MLDPVCLRIALTITTIYSGNTWKIPIQKKVGGGRVFIAKMKAVFNGTTLNGPIGKIALHCNKNLLIFSH